MFGSGKATAASAPGCWAEDDAHWSFLLDTMGSVLYGNRWQANGDGTFTSLPGRKYFSPLDLYLMGLVDKSEVPPMLLIENPEIDPTAITQSGVTIDGTAAWVSIDDIISAEGERAPGAATSQKSFNVACIFITRPGTFTGDELFRLRTIMTNWALWFSSLTDGRAAIRVDAAASVDIPGNPGVDAPPVDPRAVSAEIDDGVGWLVENQRGDGRWADAAQTAERDTAEALTALSHFPAAGDSWTAGAAWLNQTALANTDFISRKIDALSGSEKAADPWIRELISLQNADGGWGSGRGYTSNATDTALALKALAGEGYSEAAVIDAAALFLEGQQHSDGGWGIDDGESRIMTTVNALQAFLGHRDTFSGEQIQNGWSWLAAKQNPDGGFGTSPSTVYDTAGALIALKSAGMASEAANHAMAYLLNHQAASGSWHESAYQTALAVEAILKTTIDPDLWVGPADVSFQPATVTTVPSEVTVSAVIHNSGRTDVTAARVVLYENALSDENRLLESTIAVPGKSSATVTFATTIRDGNHHRYYVVVDPENEVSESFETNNTVIKTLYPGTTHDFEIRASDVSLLPAAANFNDTLTIAATVRNRGASDAFDVPLTYAVEAAGRSFDILTAAVDIPAGKTAGHEFSWVANLPDLNGSPGARLVVRVDPFNHFSEISEENNTASVPLNITGSSDPNLVVAHQKIAFDTDPANEAGRVAITARIENPGFSDAENVIVAFYQGVPGTEDALLGTRALKFLATGSFQDVIFEWEKIPAAGEKVITVHVDPEDVIREISEADNQAFKTLNVLSLPDLAVSSSAISLVPAAPREGEAAVFRVLIQNMGGQAASDVAITVRDGDAQIHAETIPVIAGNAAVEMSFSSMAAVQNGAHTVTVSVDPEDLIEEQDEGNNIAAKPFGVQDADLWLTEKYISPNGDGIQDATQFFFRLDRAESVAVEVIGENGETVRTYSEAAFENTTGGTVTWDGLKDNGTVAGDGRYSIRVKGRSGETLAGLPVVLDNNRSTMGEAVRSHAILQSNLTCMLPDTAEKVWLPNESGLVFSITASEDDSSGYPNGLYSITPDGQDVRRCVPWEWSVGVDDVYDVEYTRFSVSPDSGKIAFALKRFNKKTHGYEETQLWCTGTDGTHLASLLSYDLQESDVRIETVVWSPDSTRLAVRIRDERTGKDTLRIVASDGTANTRVPLSSWGEGAIIDASLGWSPDSNWLAFVMLADGAKQICLTDPEGTAIALDDYTGGYRDLKWLNNQKLVLVTGEFGKSSCRIIDASGNGFHREIPEFDAAELVVNPKTDTFAFIGNGLSVTVCDAAGDCSVLHEADTFIDDLRWSADGRRLAFFSEQHREIDPCLFESAFVVVAPGENDVTALGAGYYIEAVDSDIYGGPYDRCGMKFAEYDEKYRANRFYYRYGSLTWLGDEGSLMAEDENRGVFTVSPGDDGGPVYLPIENSFSIQVSPHGRAIAYDDPVDPDSICAGSDQVSDVWTMSSLLNLTADLRALRRGSGLLLRGVAADLNFESYVLEYADTAAPDVWQRVMPPSEIPVVDGEFTTWVPPYEGTFFIRLIVTDLAGNQRQDRKRVSWGLYSSITNLYKVGELFSPNGDGVKDSVELHYRVLEPSHLEFYVFNEENQLIRTFYKDHVVPPGQSLVDHILWDGRNENGITAPDGIYRIQVYDFEFFFEIDNTPPDADLNLSRIMDQIERDGSVDLNGMAVEITGHAMDDHLKRWTIEYGEGDNPDQWFEYISLKDPFQETTPSGDSAPISIFCRDQKKCKNDIPFVIGRKFRIIAEDFSGNSRTVATNYSDEVLLLASWRIPDEVKDHYNAESSYNILISNRMTDNKFCGADGNYKNRIPSELAAPAVHTLHPFHTFRETIASLVVQHGVLKDPPDTTADLTENLDWFDSSETLDSVSSKGLIDIAWDNRELPSEEPVIALRLRAVSASGETHYSFPVIVADLFAIASCVQMKWLDLPPGSPEPSFDLDGYCENIPLVPSRQKTLVFSWKKTEEGADSWREYLMYDAEAGDILPVGVFPIPRPPVDVLPAEFDIRMSSELHSADGGLKKCTLVTTINCNDPTIIVEYPKADACGGASPNLADVSGGWYANSTPVRFDNFGFDPEVLKAVSLYLQDEEEPRLLSRLDVSGKMVDTLSIDTGGLEEGSHPIKAVFDIVSGGAAFQEEAEDIMVVDRTAPEARITFPTDASRFCPKWISDETDGGWYAIDVEGSVTDNIEVQRYELWYGMGSDPAAWKPATTRALSYFDVDGKPYFEMDRKSGDQLVSAQIVGKGRKKGFLGRWDVTGLDGREVYALMLKVVDVTGNVSCHTTTFTMDRQIQLDISCSTRLFSPNSDGMFDQLEIAWEILEYTAVDVHVLQGVQSVKTLALGARHEGGQGSVVWDGTDDTGEVVPDGSYTLKVSAIDACGNVVEKSISGIEVDNTPPTLGISYPRPGGLFGTVVEVAGTAADPHFSSYRLIEVESGALLGGASHPSEDGILGRWNTYGKEGLRTLVLSAADTVGNAAEIRTTVDIAERRDLITFLSADPGVISPNGDGRLEFADIRYGLDQACDITLEIMSGNAVIRKISVKGLQPGEYGYVWDGTGDTGKVVPDGLLRVVLTAGLTSDAAVVQQEAVTLTVDTTPPGVTLANPKNQIVTRDASLLIKGDITDPNLDTYTIYVGGQSGTAIVASGTQNRRDYVFSALDHLPDGPHTLTAEAVDLGENTTRTTRIFTVDRTPPSVHLERPENGAVYGGLRDAVVISGTVADENLDAYAIRYGPGDDPGQWTVLAAGDTPPEEAVSCVLNTGESDIIPDGKYTVSLFAKDRAGWTSEARASIAVDQTPPQIEILSFGENGFIRAPAGVIGTVSDPNLQDYRVEYAEGACDTAFKWIPFKSSNLAVDNDVLASMDVLPADGIYCLKVSAADAAGNTAWKTSGFTVDTSPPLPPVLSGKLENGTDAQLTWLPNAEPDVAGYNLYRDGRKIHPDALLTEPLFMDAGLDEGVYRYTLTAVDHAGWESIPSEAVRLQVDRTPPEARIRSPRDKAAVGGLVDIKGTAFSVDDFKIYRLYFGEGAAPGSWRLVRTSPVPTAYDTLYQWDTLGLAEAEYGFRLEAEDTAGNIAAHEISVTLDNTPPPAPVLVSAAAAGTDVDLVWQGNTEADLAGYLLYRNDRIATVDGTVIGDLTPYLVAGTVYRDAGLPDGTYVYYLIAMDGAGNMSDPSNSITVEIDTRAPRAHIITPADGAKFQSTLLIQAASEDLDIVSLRFQYRPAEGGTWTDIGDPQGALSFITRLNPTIAGMSFGDYRLRAVATDKGGRTDPSPPEITVTYTDLAPPEPPENLAAVVTGSDVALAWTADAASDLSGYHVYRIDGEAKIRVNTAVLAEAAFTVKDLADGAYVFEVTAVDACGNESAPSQQARAVIFAPWLAQPYTPTDQNRIHIDGGGVAVLGQAVVELFRETDGGNVSLGTTPCGSDGTFSFDAVLLPGENRLTAAAVDDSGNTSRASEFMVVVFNEAPTAPTALTAAPDGYQCLLSWNPNPEPDVVGYHLYRDGGKVNAATPVPAENAATEVTASYDYSAEKAFDGSAASYWQCYAGPAWWQISWDAPRMISRIEIEWLEQYGELFAGKDFEVQVWSGYNWIPRVKATDNPDRVNAFDLSPAYVTDRIRISVTASTIQSWRFVAISEVRVWEENPIPAVSVNDADIPDGEHEYQVTAVDRYGFESPFSAPAKAAIGDIIPPEVPMNLSAEAVASDVFLSWTEHPDAAAYLIYRQTQDSWMNLARTSGTGYEDSGLPNGPYAYRITAVDAAGNESPPSSEAQAAVDIPPPQAPLSPGIAVVADGRTLDICWHAPPNTPAGYLLYRSTAPDAGYAPVFAAPITDECYRDASVSNDIRYYYRVVSVDAFGNESPLSETAAAEPRDSIPPHAPVLFLPTIAGRPMASMTDVVGVSGWAEPSAEVQLFEGDERRGTARASENDHVDVFPVDEESVREFALSPDSRTAAVVYGSMSSLTIIKDLVTGTTTRVTSDSGKPAWSPDGRKIAYTLYDEAWNQRVVIFDRDTGLRSQLTKDAGVNEWDPSWSADGRKIVLVSDRGGERNVWITDLSSGTMKQVTDGAGDPTLPVLSPDGGKVAYLTGWSPAALFVVDAEGGDPVRVAGDIPRNGDGRQIFSWSPAGGAIGFISRATGEPRIIVSDTETWTAAEMPLNADGVQGFRWSPDGRRMVYAARDDGSMLIGTFRADGSGATAELARLETYAVSDLHWTRSGSIQFWNNQGNTCHVVLPGGFFTVPGVRLHPGENDLIAVAADDTGNQSPPSEAVTIRYTTAPLPDPAVLPGDIIVSPPAPIAGDNALVNIVIRNPGQAAAVKTDVKVYVWNALGATELVHTETLPYIGPGAASTLRFNWDSTDQAGLNSLIVTLDSEGRIEEASEFNNTASVDFHVAIEEGVALSIRTDFEHYAANEEAAIDIALYNSGPAVDGSLEIWIEDENGTLVERFDDRPALLPYGAMTDIDLEWNTGAAIAGRYRVHAVFTSGGEIIAEEAAPFTVLPDIRISAALTTDRAHYPAHREVQAELRIDNGGMNSVVPPLAVEFSIAGGDGDVLFSEVRQVSGMMPGGSVTLAWKWNTALNPAGTYESEAVIRLEGERIASNRRVFEIDRDLTVRGTIAATPKVVPAGSSVNLQYTATNTGNHPMAGLPLTISLVDPETLETVAVETAAADLAVAQTAFGETAFSTEGLALKSYQAVLKYLDAEGESNALSTVVFTVKDLAGPLITVSSPAALAVLSCTGDLSVTVRDDASGIHAVEYRIDDGPWIPMPAVDPASGRYASSWTPSDVDSGTRLIQFRAVDTAGNMSVSEGVPVLVELCVEALPAIEADKDVVCPVNLLVWINDECHAGCGGCAVKEYDDDDKRSVGSPKGDCRECLRTDLLASIFDRIAESWQIVYDRQNFELELRNPIYSDILILGDQHPLTDHFGDELAEKVFSGTGLVSSLWLKHGNATPMDFGVRYRGKISDGTPVVHILESFTENPGHIQTDGQASRIDIEGGAEVVGWLETDGKSCKASVPGKHDDPAVVVSEYEKGRTVYFAFDLGRSLNDETFDSIADILTAAMARVHRTDASAAFHPGMMIPVRLSLENPGADIDVRITETFPSGFELYDPTAGAWVMESPWTADIHMDAGEIRNMVYYFRAPDDPGTHRAETEIRIESGHESVVVDRLGIDMVVGRGETEQVKGAIALLNSLQVSKKDRSKVDNAVKRLEKVRAREVRDQHDIDLNIHDLLAAVDSLLKVTSADISQVRLDLDLILRIMAARYYDLDPTDNDTVLLVRYVSRK